MPECAADKPLHVFSNYMKQRAGPHFKLFKEIEGFLREVARQKNTSQADIGEFLDLLWATELISLNDPWGSEDLLL